MNNTNSEHLLPIELQGHRHLELDSLRGLAAITVAVSHFAALWQQSDWYKWVNLSPFRIVCAGHEAVVLFFVLSGFVLSTPYNSGRPPTYIEFIAKRFCRIYLPYFCAVAIAAACATAFYSTQPTGNFLIDETWSEQPRIKSVLLLLLTSSSNTNEFDPALWTLILEIRMSIIFPLLFYVARRFSRLGLVATFVIPCVSLLMMSADERFRPELLTFTVAGLFILGIILQSRISEVRQFVIGLSFYNKIFLVVASVLLFEGPSALLSLKTGPTSIAAECIRDYVISIGACGIIVSAISLRTLSSHLLLSPIVLLGSRSYSIYLIHNSILFILIRTLYGHLSLSLIFPIYFLGVAGTSELFHRLVDRPSILLGRKAAKKIRSIADCRRILRDVFKPCYVFRPGVGARRLFNKIVMPRRKGVAVCWVTLPWGSRIKVNTEEIVGKAIINQGIFDISLSEVIYRLTEPGAMAVDVGANIGYVTSLMAANAGPSGSVICFEPHPDIFRTLIENAKGLGVTVLPYQIALGARDGRSNLYELDGFEVNQGTATMALHSTNNQITSRSIEVMTRTLDSLFATAAIDLLKIDVEGFEMEVLIGAEQALRSGRIKHIIYEAWDEASSPIHGYLHDRGYHVFSIGYSLFGPMLGNAKSPCRINRHWETPNYLATLVPDHVTQRLTARGWQCLRRDTLTSPY